MTEKFMEGKQKKSFTSPCIQQVISKPPAEGHEDAPTKYLKNSIL